MQNAFVRYLPNETPLWKVFWLYGVIPSNVLWAIVLAMIAAQSAVGWIALLVAVLLVYTGWIVMAVWGAADNVRNPVYGVMGRWLTVAWAVNTILFAGFLLLDLVG